MNHYGDQTGESQQNWNYSQYQSQNAYQSGYAGQSYQGQGAHGGDAHEQKWADPTYVNATFGQRLAAYIIDCIILTVILVVGLAVLAGVGAVGNEALGMTAAIAMGGLLFAVCFLYKVALEATRGQTLGKKMLGIRLIATDNRPMGWEHSIRRNVNIFYSFVPGIGSMLLMGSYIARLIAVLSSPYGQGYHDRWGNTRLIKES